MSDDNTQSFSGIFNYEKVTFSSLTPSCTSEIRENLKANIFIPFPYIGVNLTQEEYEGSEAYAAFRSQGLTKVEDYSNFVQDINHEISADTLIKCVKYFRDGDVKIAPIEISLLCSRKLAKNMARKIDDYLIDDAVGSDIKEEQAAIQAEIVFEVIPTYCNEICELETQVPNFLEQFRKFEFPFGERTADIAARIQLGSDQIRVVQERIALLQDNSSAASDNVINRINSISTDFHLYESILSRYEEAEDSQLQNFESILGTLDDACLWCACGGEVAEDVCGCWGPTSGGCGCTE